MNEFAIIAFVTPLAAAGLGWAAVLAHKGGTARMRAERRRMDEAEAASLRPATNKDIVAGSSAFSEEQTIARDITEAVSAYMRDLAKRRAARPEDQRQGR